MLDKLFNSGTRLKVLNWFLTHSDQEFFIQELLRNLGTDARNVFTELNYLEKLGILTSRKQGRERFFKANKESKYFDSLSSLFSVYQKENNSNKQALDLVVDDNLATPQVLSAAANVFRVNNILVKYNLKSKITTLLHSYENSRYTVWLNKKEFRELSKEIVEKVLIDEVYTTKLIKDFKEKQKNLTDFCVDLENQNLAKLSNKELLEKYQNYYQKYEDFSLLQWLFFEFDENNLVSNLLFEKLEEILKNKSKKSDQNLETDLILLTTDFTNSKAKEEAENFLEIVDYIEKKPKLLDYLSSTESRFIFQDLSEFDTDLLLKVKEHSKNYGWLSYSYSGPGWDTNYYLELLAGVCRQIKATGKTNLSKELKLRIKNEELKIKSLKLDLEKKYNFSEVEKAMLERVKTILDLGPDCWDTFYFAFRSVENLFREIGKRFYLSLKQIRYIYPEEMEKLFKEEAFDIEILNNRYQKSSHYSDIKLKEDKILFGAELEKLMDGFNLVKEEKRAFSLLRGFPVSPGIVFGKIVSLENLTKKPSKKSEQNLPSILVLESENFDFKDNQEIQGIILESKKPSIEFISLCRFLGIVCICGVEKASTELIENQTVILDSLHGEVVVS